MPGLLSKRYPLGVQRVSPDVPIEDIFWLLKRDGGIVIESFLDRETVEQTNREIAPKLEADKPWAGTFYPGETRRSPGLNGFAPTYTRSQLMNPLYQAVCRHFLTTSSTFWWGKEQKTSVSLPQDDYIHHKVHGEISEWIDARDLNTRESVVGLFVAGSRATRANGATRFVPGSHLWGNEREPVEDENVVYAELEVGDAFIMLGSCYHGGSANRTQTEFRLLYATFQTRGFLRQEENQYLVVSPDKLKTYDRKTQRVLGWSISEPYLGWVDFQDPLKLYYPEEFAGPATDLAEGVNEVENN